MSARDGLEALAVGVTANGAHVRRSSKPPDTRQLAEDAFRIATLMAVVISSRGADPAGPANECAVLDRLLRGTGWA